MIHGWQGRVKSSSENCQPFLEDMYWPVLTEAKAYPIYGGTWSVDGVFDVANEMMSVWPFRDPFSLMNEPYRSMGA